MFQRHLESVDMCIMENIQKEIDSLGIMICSRGIKSVITTQRPLELLYLQERIQTIVICLQKPCHIKSPQVKISIFARAVKNSPWS